MKIDHSIENVLREPNPLLEIHKLVSRYRRDGSDLPGASKAHQSALDIFHPIVYT